MENSTREPVFAGFLSLMTPGLGQVYNGQMLKGILISLLIFLIPTFLMFSGLPRTFIGLVILIAIAVFLYIMNSVEAFYVAKKQNEFALKSYNNWYFYVFFIIVVILSQLIFKKEIVKIIGPNIAKVKPYHIPSESMAPTIINGDRVMTDLKYYSQHNPQKGDIVIMVQPNKPSTNLIKRIIATEGDIIESKNKIIYLNGKPITEPYIQYINNNIIPVINNSNFGPLTVPKDSVFVMGDNRDNTLDSRHFGYVAKNQIKGKVLYLFWSKDISKIGREVK